MTTPTADQDERERAGASPVPPHIISFVVENLRDRALAAETRLKEAVTVLRDAGDFIEDEADNRSAAGSEYSDYEREPRDLAERIDALLSSISPQGKDQP